MKYFHSQRILQAPQDGRGRHVQGLGQRVRQSERFLLQACNNFGVEMTNRGTYGPRIIVEVLASAVEELT
jgi:hypothetical protein